MMRYDIIRMSGGEAMVYLEKFKLATDMDEGGFVLNYPYQLEMQCYSHNNIYPFRVFPQKRFSELEFSPVTMIYGGNGSGKSTLLNVISEKLGLERSSPFNATPFMNDYLTFCEYKLEDRTRNLPNGSKMITSDDVFDFLLDVRAINDGVAKRRDGLEREYFDTKDDHIGKIRSLDDFDEYKRRAEAQKKTASQYVTKRLERHELDFRSNGESAYVYFTQKIRENALYLLDEPENSLSATLQQELAKYIEDSARFFGCQFIISTHSPFLLSIKGAKIYDLDSVHVSVRCWQELPNVRAYYELFKNNLKDFE